MCGILGYICVQNKTIREDFLTSLVELKHRGPDASGIYENDKKSLILGHLRLSIIDLSTNSNQPFFSKDNRFIIVYNGELYNFKEIKNDCKLQTQTTGDTEVILETYVQHGSNSFAWLNGMFAFAIYDIHENKLTLCRDRFGIKPLYYYFDGTIFAFASELKALKKMKGLDLSLNANVFPHFLHVGYIPFPETAYRYIYKFPVGSFLEIDLNKSQSQPLIFQEYWKIDDQLNRHTYTNESEVKSELIRLLENSVEKQLISDVPIGTFLSGGIDSSLITAIATKLKPNKIKTFSIGYENETFNNYNEAKFAEIIAKKLARNITR